MRPLHWQKAFEEPCAPSAAGASMYKQQKKAQHDQNFQGQQRRYECLCASS